MRLIHPFHLVSNSPWPFFMSFSFLSTALSFISLIVLVPYAKYLFIVSLFFMIITLSFWFLDVSNESLYTGAHTLKVQEGLSFGFFLFVLSEIFLFSSLFFSFFYNSLIPSVDVGSVWPPCGVLVLDPYSLPLFNTFILLSSGFSLTASHNYLLSRSFSRSFGYLLLTLFLGLLFSYFQYFEYSYSLFTLTDSVYGSSFFILTGFHAFHIFLGSSFLLYSLFRLSFSHFSSNRHLFFNSSSLYWHMVDAVWLALFFSIYLWC